LKAEIQVIVEIRIYPQRYGGLIFWLRLGYTRELSRYGQVANSKCDPPFFWIKVEQKHELYLGCKYERLIVRIVLARCLAVHFLCIVALFLDGDLAVRSQTSY
jgi:hypothetical protein